jgi:hypothetical protein
VITTIPIVTSAGRIAVEVEEVENMLGNVHSPLAFATVVEVPMRCLPHLAVAMADDRLDVPAAVAARD